MLHDEASGESSTDSDGDECDGEALPAIVGVGGEVDRLCVGERLIIEDLDAADEIGHSDIEFAGARSLAAGDENGRVHGPERYVRLWVLDLETEGGTTDGVDVVAVAVNAGDGGDVGELKDEVGLVGGADELEVTPCLKGRIDLVVSVLSAEGKVLVGAVVDEEDGVGCAYFGRDGGWRRRRRLWGLGC